MGVRLASVATAAATRAAYAATRAAYAATRAAYAATIHAAVSIHAAPAAELSVAAVAVRPSTVSVTIGIHRA
jgi:hypothetical protein